VLLAGVNDSVEDAKRLAKWLSGFLSHLNVIPYNRVEGLPYQRPDTARIKAFCDVVEKAGVHISVRESGGPDIQAACGQLRTHHHTAKPTA
jgi:23S rRNA (adenine2503-C2)-methyltransferase